MVPFRVNYSLGMWLLCDWQAATMECPLVLSQILTPHCAYPASPPQISVHRFAVQLDTVVVYKCFVKGNMQTSNHIWKQRHSSRQGVTWFCSLK